MKSPFDYRYVFFAMALIIAALLGHDMTTHNWFWAAMEAVVTACNFFVFGSRSKVWSDA